MDQRRNEFKKHFIAAAMISLQEKHNMNIHWNFFATSHGKGPVDGIGGAVKRYVWTSVIQRKEIVVNRASSLVEVAGGMPQVSGLDMTTSDIETRNEALKLKVVFADAPAIKGIAGFHYLTIEDGHCVPFILTNYLLFFNESIPHDTTYYCDLYERFPCNGNLKMHPDMTLVDL